MSKSLKIIASLFSTLAATGLIAQCGPNGCSGQGYGYSQGYSQGSYYDQGQSNGGYYSNGQPSYSGNQGQGGWSNYYGSKGNNQGQGSYGHGQPAYGQDYNARQDYSGQQAYGHQGSYVDGHEPQGFDHPQADHPVVGHDGQHIKYYGQPGPDYNKATPQPVSPTAPVANPADQKVGSAQYGWNYNVADTAGQKPAPAHPSDSKPVNPTYPQSGR